MRVVYGVHAGTPCFMVHRETYWLYTHCTIRLMICVVLGKHVSLWPHPICFASVLALLIQHSKGSDNDAEETVCQTHVQCTVVG